MSAEHVDKMPADIAAQKLVGDVDPAQIRQYALDRATDVRRGIDKRAINVEKINGERGNGHYGQRSRRRPLPYGCHVMSTRTGIPFLTGIAKSDGGSNQNRIMSPELFLRSGSWLPCVTSWNGTCMTGRSGPQIEFPYIG